MKILAGLGRSEKRNAMAPRFRWRSGLLGALLVMSGVMAVVPASTNLLPNIRLVDSFAQNSPLSNGGNMQIRIGGTVNGEPGKTFSMADRSTGQAFAGYCLYLAFSPVGVGNKYADDQYVWAGNWTSGGNANRDKIAYVLQNFYPANGYFTLPNRNTTAMASAVQAAIWHYSEGAVLLSSTTPGVIADYNQLLADANAFGGSYATPRLVTMDPIASWDFTTSSTKSVTIHTRTPSGSILAGEVVTLTIPSQGSSNVTFGNGALSVTVTTDGAGNYTEPLIGTSSGGAASSFSVAAHIVGGSIVEGYEMYWTSEVKAGDPQRTVNAQMIRHSNGYYFSVDGDAGRSGFYYGLPQTVPVAGQAITPPPPPPVWSIAFNPGTLVKQLSSIPYTYVMLNTCAWIKDNPVNPYPQTLTTLTRDVPYNAPGGGTGVYHEELVIDPGAVNYNFAAQSVTPINVTGVAGDVTSNTPGPSGWSGCGGQYAYKQVASGVKIGATQDFSETMYVTWSQGGQGGSLPAPTIPVITQVYANTPAFDVRQIIGIPFG